MPDRRVILVRWLRTRQRPRGTRMAAGHIHHRGPLVEHGRVPKLSASYRCRAVHHQPVCTVRRRPLVTGGESRSTRGPGTQTRDLARCPRQRPDQTRPRQDSNLRTRLRACPMIVATSLLERGADAPPDLGPDSRKVRWLGPCGHTPIRNQGAAPRAGSIRWTRHRSGVAVGVAARRGHLAEQWLATRVRERATRRQNDGCADVQRPRRGCP